MEFRQRCTGISVGGEMFIDDDELIKSIVLAKIQTLVGLG